MPHARITTGRPFRIGHHVPKVLCKKGIWKSKVDGSTGIVFEYVELGYKDNKMHGEYTSWWADADRPEKDLLREHVFFKDGKKDGESKKWHYNGKLDLQAFYKAGYADGEYKGWFENELPRCHISFKNGTWDGEYKEWYPNGQLHSQGVYKDGKREGEHKKWHKEGPLRCQGNYNAGKREGEYKYFDYLGQLVDTVFYKDGVEVWMCQTFELSDRDTILQEVVTWVPIEHGR